MPPHSPLPRPIGRNTRRQYNHRTVNYINSNYPAGALGDLCLPSIEYRMPGDAAYLRRHPQYHQRDLRRSVPTSFMRIVGLNSMDVTATGQAKAAWPFINFYLLLNSSPSMAIAATSAGVSTMVSHTSAQGGCGFACHEFAHTSPQKMRRAPTDPRRRRA